MILKMSSLHFNRCKYKPLYPTPALQQVFSTLLYLVGVWTCEEVKAFKMWVYKRTSREFWGDEMNNEAVVQRDGRAQCIAENEVKKVVLSLTYNEK
ncbi:hypothetical protein WA026_003868 [Henosepilachna vigintioctopunctata]|uniref:Uncharacterized protein n=1 Tax=Henosepilachna vigintioctopunctata TaxID=420089 RepID=A0AAW1U8U5_9CUCU